MCITKLFMDSTSIQKSEDGSKTYQTMITLVTFRIKEMNKCQ